MMRRINKGAILMNDYPILFKLTGRLCVVVGGGAVGARKVRGLLAAGALVRLVDPDGSVEFTDIPSVEVVTRNFQSTDLDGASLAFAATDVREVNERITDAARKRGIPVNIADAPEEGDFTLPATLMRGDLSIAVATGGGSPALAVVLRDLLAEQFGDEWAQVLDIAAALRRKKLTADMKNPYTLRVLHQLIVAGLPQLLANGDAAAVDHLLVEQLGQNYTLAELGIQLSDETI